MEDKILGLHHVTAIANGAQRNYDFYTKVLGLRMVKKTVNFDDPKTYHFYYGNETGDPGTILTFFPWENIGPGRMGTGMATDIGYSINAESMAFWKERFAQHKVSFGETTTVFGEETLRFDDPDGLKFSLIAAKTADDRKPFQTPEIGAADGLKGFHTVTLTLKELDPTARILTDLFGYHQVLQEQNRYRFFTDAVATAAAIDIVVDPTGTRGVGSGGTVHHIAFRVPNEEVQQTFREKIVGLGLNITPKINRDYFFSLYFREPGGVLFEIATDNPGFTVDEPLEQLGSALKLPKQHEPSRAEIEQRLPKLQ